jgi:hypothetical protein
MKIIEREDFLTEEELDFVNNDIGDIPWFFQTSTYDKVDAGVESDMSPTPFFGHTIIERWKDKPGNHKLKINSEYFMMFLIIFERFLEENGIEYNNILRMNLNLTIGGKNEFTVPFHTDHKIPHSMVLIYLSDCTGTTVVTDKQLKDIQAGHYFFTPTKEDMENSIEIVPKKGKIINVPGPYFHSVRTSGPDEERFVCVITYD